jgi:hypothetical protein
MITNINEEMMKQPIRQVLKPVEVNKKNAQFLFDENTKDFILSHIEKFDYDSVLCIGTPSIFESLTVSTPHLATYLLDLDDRLTQFYSSAHFTQYNMFNNHFFDSKEPFDTFMKKSKNLLVCIDPPYGGIVKLIGNTVNLLKGQGVKVSLFLFYPYFNEVWINRWLPEFKMLDYKVSYENHKNFSQVNASIKKGSPARIFTNVDLERIELPEKQGYVHCDVCSKWTFKENKHCFKCETCPSKDGGEYKHCLTCKRCVKGSYEHCSKCDKCHLQSLVDCKFETRGDKRKNFQAQERAFIKRKSKGPSNNYKKSKKNKNKNKIAKVE